MLKIKSPQKQSKVGLKSKSQPSLRRAPIHSFKSSQTDVLQSVKNYLVKERFERVHKKEDARTTAYLVFILDSSASMAGQQQMAYVKGLMEQTLKRQRDQQSRYAMVVLDGDKAAIAQPFTRHPQQISRLNYSLKTGGKTNLGAAFLKAHELIRQLDKRQVQLFTFTDGKANIANGQHSPFQYAIGCYRQYLGKSIHSTIIDTERGLVKLGKAKELANELGIRYEKIEI
jgi:magnesium chelatase subunit D